MRTIMIRATDEDGNELDCKKIAITDQETWLNIEEEREGLAAILTIKKAEDCE